jgi:O-antigen/teichoic acid export membrane protein
MRAYKDIPETAVEDRASDPHRKPGEHLLASHGVIANTFALLTGRGIGLVLSGASVVLLARFLGSSQLGVYGAVYGFVILFEWVAGFGMSQILTSHGARNRARVGETLIAGSVVSSVLSLLAFGLALVIAPLAKYGGSQRILVAIAAADILLLVPIRQSAFIFQVDLKQWFGVVASTTRQILWVLLILVCWRFDLGLRGILWGRLACSAVEGTLTVVFALRLTMPHWPPDRALFKYILTRSWPLALTSLFVGIYHRFDQVLLHALSTNREVGNYTAAVNLTEIFGVLPVALMSSAFPILCRVSHHPDDFSRYLGFCYRSLISVVFAVCLAVSFVAVPIVQLFFGRDFAGSARILAVLIWSEVFVFFGVIISNALIAAGLEKYSMATTAGGALLNVGLNFLLIPRLGALGAAWATNLSYAVAGMLAFGLFPSTRPLALQGFTVVLRCGVLSLAILIALSHVALPVFVKGLIAFCLYCGCILLLKIVRREDYEGFLHGAGIKTSSFASRSEELRP